MQKRKKLIKRECVFVITVLALMFISCNDKIGLVKKIVFQDSIYSYGLYEYKIVNGDTVMSGNFSVFDKNGALRRKGKSVRSQFYGMYEDYYPNGKIESSRFRKSNKDIGEVTWFRTDGSLDTYNFYDDLGSVNFVAKYNKMNVLESCNGLILFEVYQFKLNKQDKKKVYEIGDKVKYQFMFPNIPNTERDFHFELLGYDNSKIERFVKKIEPVTLDVEEKAVKKGENTIRAYIKYKFKDERKTILADTVSFSFYVK
jgi:hypothetical protein